MDDHQNLEPSSRIPKVTLCNLKYNTPKDMVCGCQNVGPFDYNPNNEDLAELVCKGGQPKDFDAPEGWNFTTADRCNIFCNQGGFLLKKDTLKTYFFRASCLCGL